MNDSNGPNEMNVPQPTKRCINDAAQSAGGERDSGPGRHRLLRY